VPLETDEVDAVRQLADAMAIEDFDLAAYADDYQDRLRQLVEAKVKGQEVVAAPAEPPPAAVGNLMAALQRSLAAAKAKPAARAKGKPPKLAAESAVVAEVKRQRRRKTS
jgi:DNA end-binding protein Ku